MNYAAVLNKTGVDYIHSLSTFFAVAKYGKDVICSAVVNEVNQAIQHDSDQRRFDIPGRFTKSGNPMEIDLEDRHFMFLETDGE